MSSVGYATEAPPGYCLSVEEYHVHPEDAGILAGFTTYRVYLNCVNETDFLSACSGAEDNPFILNSSSGSWYNNGFNSGWNADNLNPELFGFLPELQYDSYLTIGRDGPGAAPELSTIWGLNNPTSEFRPEPGNASSEPSFGSTFTVDDPVGGLWFGVILDSIPTGQIVDGRILLMQITTTGLLCGQLNIQLFSSGQPTLNVDLNGDGQSDLADLLDLLLVYGLPDSFVPTVEELLNTWTNEKDLRCHVSFCGTGTFIMTIEGCTDPTACNFDAYANVDDGSCDFESCLTVGCTDQLACNYDPSQSS